jgi:hypothetical protein
MVGLVPVTLPLDTALALEAALVLDVVLAPPPALLVPEALLAPAVLVPAVPPVRTFEVLPLRALVLVVLPVRAPDALLAPPDVFVLFMFPERALLGLDMPPERAPVLPGVFFLVGDFFTVDLALLSDALAGISEATAVDAAGITTGAGATTAVVAGVAAGTGATSVVAAAVLVGTVSAGAASVVFSTGVLGAAAGTSCANISAPVNAAKAINKTTATIPLIFLISIFSPQYDPTSHIDYNTKYKGIQ